MPLKPFTLIALALSTNAALAGPFGLDMGVKGESLAAQEANEYGFSVIPEVPTRHPNLVLYSGKFAPAAGLCMVVAASRDYENDRYGEAVREGFDHLRSQLDKTYGPSDLFDQIRPSAMWDDEDDWVMSVRQNERTYQASWDAESGAELADGVTEILLTVRGFDSDTSDFVVQYRFENDAACDRELLDVGRNAL